MKKACLIGCGNISKKHLDAISSLSDVKLVAVSDIDVNKCKSVADKFNCSIYENFDEMIERTNPDVVHICTPHYLHADMGMFAISRNINVIFEKPGALRLEDFNRLINAQKKTKCISAVVFQNRLNNSVIAAKNIIDSGKYGQVIGCSGMVHWNRDSQYYKSSIWRSRKNEAGGGVLITQAIHTVDLMQYLLGPITDVKSLLGNIYNYNIEVEDTISSYIKFKNGYTGFLSATVVNPCNIPAELTIYFQDVRLVISGSDLYVYEKSVNGTNNYQIISEEKSDICYGNSHVKFLKKFYNDIDKQVTDLPSLKDARDVFNIIEKMYLSSRDAITR